MTTWQESKQAFLDRWPLEKVKTMTLEEYTNTEKNDSFTYWLSTKTSDVIGTQGSFPHSGGIYKTSGNNDNSAQLNKGQNTDQDNEYIWYSRYGSNKTDAFLKVKELLVAVVENALNKQFSDIDEIKLAPTFKWKIAYMYAPEDSLIRIASDKAMKYLCETETNVKLNTVSEFHQQLIKAKPENESFDDYSMRLWELFDKHSKSKGKQVEIKKDIREDGEMNSIIELLQTKKQIILQGPPGTGKTYNAKNLAEQLIFNSISDNKTEQARNLEKSEQFSLVQFHPSYTYEDFVRGISAQSHDGNIVYETQNKIFAEFAEKASNNLNAVKKDVEELSKQQRIENLLIQFSDNIQDVIDENESYEITPAVSVLAVENDAFRYSGKWKVSQRMKFFDLVQAQLKGVKTRKELKELDGISGLAKHHSSYFIKVLNKFQKEFKSELNASIKTQVEKPDLKKYILLIDEINRANLPSVLGELIYALEYRNEPVESLYALDGDNSITVPDNLYIIGTMNTADRSVGHIDYAIKRRFAFVDVLPDIDVIENETAKQLYERVSELFVQKNEGKAVNSEYLASDFEFKDVQLGHSYFLLKQGAEEEQRAELAMRLKYEIVPILNEYVKDGLLLESAKQKIEEIKGFEF